MNNKNVKKIRQVAKRQLTDTVRIFYNHLLDKKPWWIPRWLWKRFLKWIISL